MLGTEDRERNDKPLHAELGGDVQQAEHAVLGVLRDEVALRAAEEDDDRVEGPHGGGEHLF